MDRSDRKQLPAFASKAEEAAWWYDNREKLDEEFVAAIRSGRARFGRLEDRIAEARSIRLDAEDEARAMALAKQRGVEYRTFVKGSSTMLCSDRSRQLSRKPSGGECNERRSGVYCAGTEAVGA